MLPSQNKLKSVSFSLRRPPELLYDWPGDEDVKDVPGGPDAAAAEPGAVDVDVPPAKG